MSSRSRRRRGGDSGTLNPNLTPLLDVVLQLITFFMMLIHFGTRIEGATRAVKLPVTPAALPGADLAIDRLTVAIDDRGRLLVEGKRDGGAGGRNLVGRAGRASPERHGDARRTGRTSCRRS